MVASRSSKDIKTFWIIGLLSVSLFTVLLLARFGVFDSLGSRPKTVTASGLTAKTEKDSWLNIFQGQRKIGFAHTHLSPTSNGYRLDEDVIMRINTMGMVQDLRLKTHSQLATDMSLTGFKVTIASGRFHFSARGSVNDTTLTVWTSGNGEAERRAQMVLKKKTYLAAGVIGAMGAIQTTPGDAYEFDVFDPTTMGQRTVRVDIIGPEQIRLSGQMHPTTKISLSFKGATQLAWINSEGDLVKQSGLLGIRMEKTTRSDALNQSTIRSSEDLTRQASVALQKPLSNPLNRQRLTVSISGVSTKGLQLAGGRQRFIDNQLMVEKESLLGLPEDLTMEDLGQLEKIYLQSEPLIQADHPKVRQLVEAILSGSNKAAPLEKIRLLTEWIQNNIQKRPVVSVPDALSTLENRMGDCNEHAMLLAALARSAGIPARVEAGLVYLRGRFYYHAWNLVYLGRWITVDSLFGQLPADVTHLRLVTGSQQEQLDLIGLIGKIKLDVIEHD